MDPYVIDPAHRNARAAELARKKGEEAGLTASEDHALVAAVMGNDRIASAVTKLLPPPPEPAEDAPSEPAQA